MSKRLRILVTGSRNLTDKSLVQSVLNLATSFAGKNVIVVHGGAPGADSLADEVARDNRWEVEVHPAEWDKYGKRAGYVRNAEMADLGADVCFAFPVGESRGTRMMIRLAQEAGIPVKVFEDMS